MNYGKKSISKKRKALTSCSSMLGKRAHVSFLRVLLISVISVGVLGLCLGIGAFKGIIDNAPDVSEIDIMPLGYATFIYDSDGNQIRKLSASDSNRLPVSLDQIPEDLQHAVIAIEDERFYEHNGIDVRGIIRAFVTGVSNGFNWTEGASTITQQLLKNNVFTDWTEESTWAEKFVRKFQEQYLAIQIEKEVDKDTILENYLNTINLGAGAYGVQAAAQTYFNKDVSELTLSECATIAGITQNPTRYNPIENPEENADRRQLVLDNMLEQGYISQAEYDEAMNDDVYSRIQEASAQTQTEQSSVYTYFEDELIDQVIDALMTVKGYTETQARNAVYSGGLQIYSTQDPQIQQILDEEYANPENYPDYVQYSLDYALTVTNPEGEQVNYSKEMLTLYFKEQDPSFDLLFDSQEEGQSYVDQYKAYVTSDGSQVVAERVSFAPQPQSSMSVIDQSTGYVKAIVGGRGEKTASLTLNRATDTTRQPGSTFKIVSTYAPALDSKDMTLATTYEDEPYEYPDGSPVENSDRTYRGTTTIRSAIRQSVNVVAVKCLEDVTPRLGLEYLSAFGFTTLDQENDAYLPLALGGIYNGVTNVELCAAYAAIANQGNYIKPTYFTRILDREGNVLIDNTTQASSSVIRESTAWLLTSAMEDVVNYGTGTMCQLDNMAVAGKTGTTDDYGDLWFAGYTPYYTCTVWSGFDNNELIPDDYMSRNFHKILWQKVMTRIHENLEYKDFEMPATVEEATVCSETGLLPASGCSTITEYFDVNTLPTERCTEHYYVPTPVPEYDDDEEEEDPDATPTPSVTDTPEDPSITDPPEPTDVPPSTDPDDPSDPGTEDPGIEDPGDGTDENPDAPL